MRHRHLGLVYWASGRAGMAVDPFTAALAVNERTGEVALRAANLGNLGMVSITLGRLVSAAHLTEALEAFGQIGSRTRRSSRRPARPWPSPR